MTCGRGLVDDDDIRTMLKDDCRQPSRFLPRFVYNTFRTRPCSCQPSPVNAADSQHNATAEDGGVVYLLLKRCFCVFVARTSRSQTLYVKVVEGRGLMASDLSGRSDPYVKLCLTGRCAPASLLPVPNQSSLCFYAIDFGCFPRLT